MSTILVAKTKIFLPQPIKLALAAGLGIRHLPSFISLRKFGKGKKQAGK
jgi:hypothetical protein